MLEGCPWPQIIRRSNKDINGKWNWARNEPEQNVWQIDEKVIEEDWPYSKDRLSKNNLNQIEPDLYFQKGQNIHLKSFYNGQISEKEDEQLENTFLLEEINLQQEEFNRMDDNMSDDIEIDDVDNALNISPYKKLNRFHEFESNRDWSTLMTPQNKNSDISKDLSYDNEKQIRLEKFSDNLSDSSLSDLSWCSRKDDRLLKAPIKSIEESKTNLNIFQTKKLRHFRDSSDEDKVDNPEELSMQSIEDEIEDEFLDFEPPKNPRLLKVNVDSRQNFTTPQKHKTYVKRRDHSSNTINYSPRNSAFKVKNLLWAPKKYIRGSSSSSIKDGSASSSYRKKCSYQRSRSKGNTCEINVDIMDCSKLEKSSDKMSDRFNLTEESVEKLDISKIDDINKNIGNEVTDQLYDMKF